MNLPISSIHALFLVLVSCGSWVLIAQGQSFDLSYSIDEEVPVNTVVGNVGRDANIHQLLSSDDYATLRYRVLLYPETHNNFFTIVNTTGVLKTASHIDREILCFYEIVCKLSIHVAAQTDSGQQFYTFKITVFVKDINDNSPTFSISTMNVKIDEDAALSTSIPIMSATDRDILNNTIQRYTLVSNSDIFGLKITRNLDDSLTPQLYVKSLMDRERQPHYFLKVLALDGGSPRRSGELTVNVTLNDVNDNAPRFSKQIYDESVAETAPIGHRVMTLTATDEDMGNNGRVSFRLGARQSEESFNTFRVVANTGDILTLRDLTPLQGQTLRLVVEAVDLGVKSQTAQAVVNIHVIDTVNNAPIIRMTIPPGSPISRIIESASPGFVVAHFMVQDADSGENGAVSCHLKDDVFSLQRLKESEYKVTVYNTLDRERVPFYEVIIKCVDGGTPSLTSTVAFSVILEDANDNPPKFLRAVYRVNISENINSFILKVEAQDADLGQNASVTYRLGDVTPLVASHIHINPNTGEVNTKQMLDHELFKQLDFHVVATDAGTPSLSSTARVIIDVIDQNDNTPRVPNGYYLSVPENKPPGTFFGRVKAIDPDEGLGGQIGYQLRSDNDATKYFNLSQNGEIRTLMTFDREKKPIYDIDILAWDHGSNPQTNDLHVRIIIADVNDHTPVFEFPNSNNKTVHTTLESRYNSTVTTVHATDQDLGENATLTYTIMEGGRDVFEIEPRTGRVYTLRTLYTNDKGTYSMSLFVRDNGAQPLSATSTLVVVIAQGNGTAAASTLGSNEHIIIVAILVGITIFIAIVVFLIVIRFSKRDGRNRRTKYISGLPNDAKARTPITEEHQSSDDEPCRNYDSNKKSNGPMMAGDAAYEVNDDIIMFKLKLVDQYKELEPEDKDPCYRKQYDDDNSNDALDIDCAADLPRVISMTRLATYQNRTTVVQPSSYICNPDPKEKVWRSTFKDKMTDEMMSSSSRETTGADSGKGPSEDGSTDETGCFISPRNSIRRGNAAKAAQNNFPRPTSSCGYDRPQFLMTFQPTSPDPNSEEGMSFKFSPRAEYSQNNFPSPSDPRHFSGFGKDFSMMCSTERLPTGDMTDQDNKHGTLKKVFSNPNTGGTKKETHKGDGNERNIHPDKMRMCSEPPTVVMGDTLMSAYSTHAIQETGRATPPGHLQPFAVHVSSGNHVYGDMYLVRSPGSRQRFICPQPSNYLQTCQNPNSYKQASCPQLFEEVTLMDMQGDNFIPMTCRSTSYFNNNRGGLSKSPSRSVQNINDPREIGLSKSPSRSIQNICDPREMGLSKTPARSIQNMCDPREMGLSKTPARSIQNMCDPREMGLSKTPARSIQNINDPREMGLSRSPARSIQNINDPRETQDDCNTMMTSGSYFINPDELAELSQSDAFV